MSAALLIALALLQHEHHQMTCVVDTAKISFGNYV